MNGESERGLEAVLEKAFADAPRVEAQTVVCQACLAVIRPESSASVSRCPFCDGTTSPPSLRSILAPQVLVPFSIDAKAAKALSGTWFSSRWVSPRDIICKARTGDLVGSYLPFLLWSAASETRYRGERGDWSYTYKRTLHVYYGARFEDTIRIRHVNWQCRSGTLKRSFDDGLIVASQGVPQSLIRKLEPWDLQAVVPYQDSHSSGVQTECALPGRSPNLAPCKGPRDKKILSEIRSKIGGDEQRIHEAKTSWIDATFTHLLLPVWVSTFRYRGRTYRVVVNAQTGKVQGQRPWSWVKLASLAFALTVMIGTI